jgi:hypothetical protein
MKMEAEASRLREKIEQMIKFIITEKKKEVKLAQLEARREDA